MNTDELRTSIEHERYHYLEELTAFDKKHSSPSLPPTYEADKQRSDIHTRHNDFLMALFADALTEARIDELKHVDRHTTWYPDGSEPIEVQNRITQLLTQQRSAK